MKSQQFIPDRLRDDYTDKDFTEQPFLTSFEQRGNRCGVGNDVISVGGTSGHRRP